MTELKRPNRTSLEPISLRNSIEEMVKQLNGQNYKTNAEILREWREYATALEEEIRLLQDENTRATMYALSKEFMSNREQRYSADDIVPIMADFITTYGDVQFDMEMAEVIARRYLLDRAMESMEDFE